ncbi:MAG: peptide chain release factor N(5)-glutamine methyltransferase [Pseudolysinimonas sp.]
MQSIQSLRTHAIRVLSEAGVPTPDADAELLIGHVLGLTRGQVQAKAVTDAGVGPDDAMAVIEVVERRAAREPLQHITGRAAFRQLELAVGPGVFVPRPETETVAQLAIDALLAVPSPAPLAIDLGTGSGAIALALATEVPHASVVAVENSPRAFVWTKQNAREVAAPNLRLVFADLAEAVPELDGTVDVVVSNPPYIPVGAVPRDPEVRLHDPEHALYGGVDGLDGVRAVSLRARALLRPGGTLVLEHGDLQGPEIRALLASDGWRAPVTTTDLLGRDRATTATAPAPAG